MFYVQHTYNFGHGPESMLVQGPFSTVEDANYAANALLEDARQKKSTLKPHQNIFLDASLKAVSGPAQRPRRWVDDYTKWVDRITKNKQGIKEAPTSQVPCDAPACRCGPAVACQHAAQA
jgi:hypothetical protein